MSKYTKIVATLGVITGLGIASLPLATFAAPIPLDGSVPSSQNVVVQLTVGDAVAVAVDSNNVNAGNVSPNQTKNVSTTVSYATNHNTGMTLTVKDLDDYIVFADLLGGTPCNVVSRLILEGLQIELYAGMNMPMVIEFINSALTGVEAKYIEKANKYIVKVNDVLAEMNDDEDE